MATSPTGTTATSAPTPKPAKIDHVSPGLNPRQVLMIGELAQAYATEKTMMAIAMLEQNVTNDMANAMEEKCSTAELRMMTYLEQCQSKEYFPHSALYAPPLNHPSTPAAAGAPSAPPAAKT